MGKRPSLVRPSAFMLTWHVCTWLGAALLIAALLDLDGADLRAMGPPLLMMLVLVVLGELRPIVMAPLEGSPVSISQAFVFATMYLWGWEPAVLLFALSTIQSEIMARREPWRIAFNTGQYTLSLLAAWAVMVFVGVQPTPEAPLSTIAATDLPWVIGTWIVFHHVNLALVAGVSMARGQSFRESLTEEYAFYTVSAFAVLALSPLVVAIVLPGQGAWGLLPLLMLPLLAVQRAAEMSRAKEHQSLHDTLTDLPNRLLLSDRIEQALARADPPRRQVSVMLLDLDNFKVINDGMGHEAGDEVLLELSRRLRATVSPSDTLARFGGDEFVVVHESAPGSGAADALATRIAACLDEPFTLGDRVVAMSASIGVVEAVGHHDAGTLIRDADAAMHQAKAGGRSRTVVFDSAMHHEATRRLDSEEGLRRALAEGQLRVYYQPIVDIDSGRARGVEALVRWQHPERGLVGPNEFIPIAEETGLIVPLGGWVMHEAMAQVSRWRRELPGCRNLTVSVNLSARQLQSADIGRTVSQAMSGSGLPPRAISLEVTESVVMGEGETAAREVLGRLRGLGVGVAIDDFGTGYSSLSYLKKLPVTTLKVDRSFTTGLGTSDTNDLAIVNAIIGMAAGLGLEVVVEGVETNEQLLDLRRLGPDGAQGFLWSRPLPPDQMAQWLGQAQN